MMTHISSRVSRYLRSIANDNSGVAMVEFAATMPFFLALTMTGTELANFAMVNFKLNQIAMQAVDNASRERPTIDEADFHEIAAGIRSTGMRIDFANRGRVIISSLGDNGLTGTNAGLKINWQRCYGARDVTSTYGVENDGATNNSLATGMGPTANRVVPPAGAFINFAEVRYTYRPIISSTIARMLPPLRNDFDMRQTAAFVVRERLTEAMGNAASLTTAQKRLCDSSHLSAT